MDDRELLEFAAKASGIDAEFHPDEGYSAEGMWLKGARTPDNDQYWNPLTKDGDAHRLAVKLRITLSFSGVSETVQAHVRANLPKKHRWWANSDPTCVSVEYVPEEMWSGREDDIRFANWYMQEYQGMVRGLEAATRRAVVLAAVKIGQAKGEEGKT